MIKRLEALLERARFWPEAAQVELAHVADQIETELTGDYVASQEELSAIEAALAAVDCGELASDQEVAAAFAKFGRK